MSMLETHSRALSGVVTKYHEFLGRYNTKKKRIYGFFEGKDDFSFYTGAIQHYLPKDWDVDLWAIGNKDKVIQLYGFFDWNRFLKKQVLFFVDRDLSLFTGEKIPEYENFYTTDKYSIENDIVNRTVCDRVLTEICGLADLYKEEKDKILNLFEQELSCFRTEMTPVMARIILWKRRTYKQNLDNINMKDLFSIKKGKLMTNTNPKDKTTLEEYLHEQCRIESIDYSEFGTVLSEFKLNDGPKKFVRGKYELWFLVAFVKSIHTSISSFSIKITKPPKMHTLVLKNAMQLIGPRAQTPNSLHVFLEATCLVYVQKKNESPRGPGLSF
jgi:hypothetical protein